MPIIRLGDVVFAIEAWVPSSRVKGLLALLSGLSVYCEQIAIEHHDRVPTCMENSGAAKIGEDLVHIYDTPSTNDKDPSSWVLVFFSIFFAMIVADAGYGLIYLALGMLLEMEVSPDRRQKQAFHQVTDHSGFHDALSGGF